MLKIPDGGCAMQPKAISLWEGTIQLNLSSLINVVAIFKRFVFPMLHVINVGD